ncbi:hypothetical protein DQ04_03311000 [Trypanosoma grayi]|uniref:hypothetical protein n=1 Tax=Trypanosoma grayi TaxID=71804 RepID=UPI0004F467BA|nr:hypothetical protein DQ04_03311000 [Trypanosoma grayi]KEG10766.1 hypothetical protein DQ04_03311000 [Trypanosoma grayi]
MQKSSKPNNTPHPTRRSVANGGEISPPGNSPLKPQLLTTPVEDGLDVRAKNGSRVAVTAKWEMHHHGSRHHSEARQHNPSATWRDVQTRTYLSESPLPVEVVPPKRSLMCAQSDGYSRPSVEPLRERSFNGCRSMPSDSLPHKGTDQQTHPPPLTKRESSTTMEEEEEEVEEKSRSPDPPSHTKRSRPRERRTAQHMKMHLCNDNKPILCECHRVSTVSEEEIANSPAHSSQRNMRNNKRQPHMVKSGCDAMEPPLLLCTEPECQILQGQEEPHASPMEGACTKKKDVSAMPPLPRDNVFLDSPAEPSAPCEPTSPGENKKTESKGWNNQQKQAATLPCIDSLQRLWQVGGCDTSSSINTPLDRHRQCTCRFTPEVSPALCRLVDERVVASLAQNIEKMMQYRRAQLHCLAKYLTEAISQVAWSKGVRYGDIRFFVFGSVATCTVLPDGDNDMTIDVCGLLNPTKVPGQVDSTAESGDRATASSCSSSSSAISSSQAATVACCELLSSVSEYLRQHNTSVYVDALVLAEVQVLKLVMEGSSYDITVSQLGGVDCVRFLHEMDMMIGCRHLLKRTLLLLKAWCCYEAHVLSGQGGYISSYAASVMLIAMMNTVEFLEDVELENMNDKEKEGQKNQDTEGEQLEWHQRGTIKEISPLQLLARFLKFFAYFDFEHYCVTVFGPLPCTSINGTSLDLSHLEVPAARKEKLNKVPETSDVNQKNDLELMVDVNVLGLTKEGQAALGHCIRRRAKPLVTVSGVKHMLQEEYVRRQRGREGQDELNPQADRASLCGNASEAERLRINRRGCVEEDENLLCTTCNTSSFPLRTMNVMDPLRWSASVCRGVCRNHLQRIRRAFKEGLTLFEMASAKLSDVSPPSLSPVSSGRSDVGFDSSASTYQTGESATDSVDVVAMGSSCLDPIKESILLDLFGQTLAMLQKHFPKYAWSNPHAQQMQCQQCTRPSVFCVPDARQVCGAQFVFERQDDAVSCRDDRDDGRSREPPLFEGACNSSLAAASMQQQQRQINPLACASSLAPPPLLVSTPSTSTHPDSPAQAANGVISGSWSVPGTHVNGDPSLTSVSIRHHLARGAPLVRTCIKGTGTLVGQRAPAATANALTATGGLLYSTEPVSISYYPGRSTTVTRVAKCKPSVKQAGMEKAPMNFAPSSTSTDTILPCSAAPQRYRGN